jgi:hypothetical protein
MHVLTEEQFHLEMEPILNQIFDTEANLLTVRVLSSGNKLS